MSDLLPAYMGSVNRWECDENDHLNVRFYVHKIFQTLETALLDLDLFDSEEITSLSRKIRVQHMRFGAEARIAEPITGLFGLLDTSEQNFSALVELQNSATGSVIAAFTFEIEHPLPDSCPNTVTLPAHAGNRGLDSQPFPYARLSLKNCFDAGFNLIGKGRVQAEECGPDGYLLPYQYMGRSSDSMPNLLMRFSASKPGELSGDSVLGNAVLEYRMNFYSSLKLGDRFAMVSGLSKLGNKTFNMAHLIFNSNTGACVLGSESVSINMDLDKRKSTALTLTQREVMTHYLIQHA
ncbi:MAG: acyl-ACP thioesterase [Pseudomonadales bacterium]|nr:acyl-ACP thioesterase [Pseudomonadales bacterium]